MKIIVKLTQIIYSTFNFSSLIATAYRNQKTGSGQGRTLRSQKIFKNSYTLT